MIYFDNAATTYPKPQCVYDAITEGTKNYSFNAGRGSYRQAKDTFNMIEETRTKVANFVDISKNQVIFTSSATESLNNIIYGLKLNVDDIVFVSPFEHNAIIRTLINVGVKVFIIPFDKATWNIDIDNLNNLYVLKRPKATLISHISNVTGFELPYKDIFSIAKRYSSITVLDCSQSFGIYKINKQNVDFMVFAGHKSLYSIFGIAGYINCSLFNLDTYKVGGTGTDSLNPNMPTETPLKYEAGSPNSPAIYTLGKSCDYLSKGEFDKLEENLTAYLLEKLSKFGNIKIYLPKGYISKGIVSFNVDGYSPVDVGMILSEDFDICVRTGFHCAPYVHEFIGSLDNHGTVRVSIGIFNTKQEIDELIEALNSL